MRFTLIDRISDLKPGESITALKVLSLAEEYLQDHFPRFPVMPGVLMLEAMYQASAMLVFLSEDFHHSTILLKEARNVKYADFVRPGETLVVHAELLKMDDSLATLKAKGVVAGEPAVSGKLVLERFNASDRLPQRAAWDDHARMKMRQHLEMLYRRNHSG
ncbi:MAG: beta-hydroxyacyl-ACP dehydratase [Pirellulaceae bacterium]|jgi:3-hydroxyacyl-[acyl-carrier-protein] dehydratase|nr:beta-hydroxyacyl-ACP dehydratase [Pirellulaceae bacterium]